MWHMAIQAFIADISPPEQRGFRIAMVTLAQGLPRPISPIIGAALYEKGNIKIPIKFKSSSFLCKSII